jgi:formylmethanofuran dehydrogenase subunit A|uniref:Amidohydrolase 3 domain-containing protein n=1 Tax=Desulfobacca acetoxidans TaxID=60893 RepID=A0A7C3SI89_9BACT
MRLKITGGRVYDPASGWHGQVRDLFVEGERLVARLTKVDRTIDARDRAVLAGGIDLRGQVATCGLNLLHLWDGKPGLHPLGLEYACLGFTHVHEPFLTLVTAPLVHRQLAAIPIVDASASLVLNLRDLDLWLKERPRWPEIAETIRFLLERTRTLDLRVVEPFVRYRQDIYAHRTLKSAEALEILTRLALDHGLRFVLEATPEVLQAPVLEPRAFHLSALGQALLDDDLAAAAWRHLQAGVTADCGLARPDSEPQEPPLKVDLGWFQPLNLRPAVSKSQAWRALELALRYPGPRLAFSALGPRRAPAREYPRMFGWLLDRQARRTEWEEELNLREWSLSDWARATRTLPARVLGFKDRGHLSPGARADIAIYDFPPESAGLSLCESLSRVRTLIKRGEVVIDNFQVIRPQVAKAIYFRQTRAQATSLLEDICQYRSFRLENLWVPDEMGGPWVALE